MNYKRGIFFLVTAWAIWIVTGYIINIGLGRSLGPEVYGIYGTVMSVLLWFEIFIITGIPYAVQKFVSSDVENAYSILWTAGLIQCIMILCMLCGSFFTAPLLAKIFKDDRLVLYFRIAFINILFYGIFYLFVSFQNGLQNFGKQALLLTVYNVSKLLFIFLSILIFQSLVSIFLAMTVGSIIGSLVGYILINDKKRHPLYNKKQLISFAFPVLIYSLATNLFLYIDFWIVTVYLGKTVSGYFFAASTIARIPYFFVLSLTAVVLPAISSKLVSHSFQEVKDIIQSACRMLLLISVPVGILTTIYNKDIILILYQSAYESGGVIVSVLIWGMIFLAYLLLLSTIINADHRPIISVCIVMTAIVVDILLNIVLVPKYGAVGGAIATTIATGMGFIIALVWTYKRFHVFVRGKTFIRVAIAGLFVWVSSKVFIVHGSAILLLALVNVIFYSLILIISKEIRIDDIINLFRNVERIESIAPGSGESLNL